MYEMAGSAPLNLALPLGIWAATFVGDSMMIKFLYGEAPARFFNGIFK